MIKKPGQNGQNAIWDSGLAKEGRTLVKGNSRYGSNCMEVMKADTPYKAGPVSSLAK